MKIWNIPSHDTHICAIIEKWNCCIFHIHIYIIHFFWHQNEFLTLHNCWPDDSSSNGCLVKHLEQANSGCLVLLELISDDDDAVLTRELHVYTNKKKKKLNAKDSLPKYCRVVEYNNDVAFTLSCWKKKITNQITILILTLDRATNGFIYFIFLTFFLKKYLNNGPRRHRLS